MGGKKLTGLAAPTNAGDAARKDEVDTKANEADVIKKDGTVEFTGNQAMGGKKLTGLGAPTGAGDAARKDEVDDCEKTANKGAASGYASLDVSQKVVEDPVTAFIKPDGSVDFTGNQAMGGKKLTGLGAPTASGDAARKDEIDDVLALVGTGEVDASLVNAIRALTDPYLLDVLSFADGDPYTEQGDGGQSFNYKGTSVELKTSGANSDQAWLYKNAIYANYVYNERKLIFEIAIFNLDAVTDQLGFLVLHSKTTELPCGNADNFGFIIDGADLKGQIQRGGSSHNTDLATALSAGAQVTRLKAILYYGEKCEFYVNGVLKGTDTTTASLPDGDSDLYFQAILEAEEAAAKGIEIGGVVLYSPRSYWLSKALAAEGVPGACGMFKIRNPERTVDIIVDEVLVDITTGSTGVAKADIGVGTVASDDTLLDEMNLQTVQVHNNVDDNGTNGRKSQKVDSGAYVVGTASADSSGLVGKAYVHYRLA